MPLSARGDRLTLGRAVEVDFVTTDLDTGCFGSVDLRLTGSKGIGLRVESSDALLGESSEGVEGISNLAPNAQPGNDLAVVVLVFFHDVCQQTLPLTNHF